MSVKFCCWLGGNTIFPPSEWNLVLSSENLEERHFNKLKQIVERYQELKEVSMLVKDSGFKERHLVDEQGLENNS